MKAASFEKIRKVISCTATFGQKEFDFSQIERMLRAEKVSTFEFYRLYYAGAVDKLRFGIYKINPKFYTISAEEIFTKSNEKIKAMRKLYNDKKLAKKPSQEKSNVQTTIFPPVNAVNDAIALLKSHGYRILKPIQQFEEI
jgi:hypothetical protein